MKTLLRAVILLMVVLWPVASTVDADERLTMTVSPAQSFAPATLRMRVRLEPHADNRGLVVRADSGDFYRSSEVQLDGERTPRVMVFEFRAVPSGEYDVTGTVFDAAGRERACVHRRANVLGWSEP